MLRLFNLFGRSTALNAFDDVLRASGVYPLLVPEAVKLTVLRLHKQDGVAGATGADFGDAAERLAYCILGRDQFVDATSVAVADRAEERVDAAIAGCDSLDARLILLALHAGLAPEVADQIEAEAR